MKQQNNNRNVRSEPAQPTSAGKTGYIGMLMSDSRLRFLTITAAVGGWNFVYAVFQLILAAVNRSYWFLTMGLYYLVVCVMKASALYKGKRNRSAASLLKTGGIMIFVLAFIFTGVVVLSIIERRNSVYHMYIAIAMAAYTFYCCTMAIINFLKCRKQHTVRNIMLRSTAMVCSLGSMFGLERMMLGTFGDAAGHTTYTMEVASGTGFFILIVLIGINLIRLSRRAKVQGHRRNFNV